MSAADKKKICELVHLEIFRAVSSGPDRAGAKPAADQIADLVRRWLSTGNQHNLDLALISCGQLEISVPWTFQAQLEKAALQRLTGAERAGTPKKVMKEFHHDRALEAMAHLRALDFTLESAASKAAHSLQASSAYPLRASSLEKMYAKSDWPRMESEMRDDYLASGLWEQLRKNADRWPDVQEDLRGSRR